MPDSSPKGVVSGRIQGEPLRNSFVVQNRYDSMVAMKTNTVTRTTARQLDEHRDKATKTEKWSCYHLLALMGHTPPWHTPPAYVTQCVPTAYQCGCTQSAQHCSSAAVCPL